MIVYNNYYTVISTAIGILLLRNKAYHVIMKMTSCSKLLAEDEDGGQ
jgi:hypothetical protein